MSKCGAWSEEEPVTPEVTKICMMMKSEIENKTGANFEVYTPLSFRHQILAGTNYMVKVHVGGEECFHALIFEFITCCGGTLTVTDVQITKALSDPLPPL